MTAEENLKRLSDLAKAATPANPQTLLTLIEVIRLQNEALKFYANKDNYDTTDGSLHDMKPKGFDRKLYRVLEFGERADDVVTEVDRRLGELK